MTETLEGLEVITIFLGLYNIFEKQNVPAFLMTKRVGLLFRKADQGVLL